MALGAGFNGCSQTVAQEGARAGRTCRWPGCGPGYVLNASAACEFKGIECRWEVAVEFSALDRNQIKMKPADLHAIRIANRK